MVCFTSTGELHERLYAPYGRSTGAAAGSRPTSSSEPDRNPFVIARTAARGKHGKVVLRVIE
jgi:hypothetical protein